MATLRDIKNRINGVQTTQQITKAMKMVAAAKLRRAQEAIINARPYSKKISEMMRDLITGDDIANNPFITPREVKNIALVIVSSDRGLCGAFNTNLIKEVTRYIDEDLQNTSAATHIFCVGRKGYEFFSKRNYSIAGERTGLFANLRYDTALNITNELIKKYLDGTYDKIIVFYNEFKSIIQQKIVAEQFLPVPVNNEQGKEKQQQDYIYEPNQKEIFNYLLPKHLKAQMWRILLESNASEFGAKMTAMDNATTNASELIHTLSVKYNRERQAAITKELIEIVSGSNALKEG
jgi:F-type H+-transporting ATPase subunit gamma